MKPLLEPVIETPRLLLRPPRLRDLDDLVAGVGDLRVSRMLGRVPHPYTRADAENFLAAVKRNARSGKSLNLSIFRDGRLIGGIGTSALPAYCEFGYWLAYDAWGKGFATEAAGAVLAYGFDVLGLGLIRSGILAGNTASMRVQVKLGFRRIGISRRISLARDAMIDHIDTVLTRARFEALAR
ncbi:GNAT family N-acetyltransferase [soil metagenome]